MAYGLTHYRGSRRVSDCIKFHCGDLVCDIADERHVGEVRAIERDVFVTVRWLETGWRSVVHSNRLKEATR